MIADVAQSANYIMDLKFLTCHLYLFDDATATSIFASCKALAAWDEQLPRMAVQNYLENHLQTHPFPQSVKI